MFKLSILRRKLEFTFEKDPDDRWYVVLPEYPGLRRNLEMVFGADKMCEDLYNPDMDKDFKFKVDIGCKKDFNRREYFILRRIEDEVYIGRNYQYHDGFGGLPTAWLCPVMLYVFGHYPKDIYIWTK